MTAAAFEHAELLRRLARQDVEPIASNTALATELNRDPSNLRKTFKALADDGVLNWTPGEVPTVTDLGRQTLRGIDVAQGLASPDAANPRWPLDRIRPNPANRVVDPEGIEDMALSIVAVTPPDVYTPVTLTPVDDDGFRMLLAGERRWRGALKARDEHDLSAAPIAEGLLFVEREATEAEALQLMIIENTQREGLSPLEDARQLFRLQQLTGLNGVDLAIHVGRCDRLNKNGAKDVQEKLKIIREATPEAIADYEARGSWDDLRNSVRTKREASDQTADETVPTGPHVVNGVDYYNASHAHQARVAAGLEPRPSANYGAATTPAAPTELSDRARLALVELAFKIHASHQPLDPAADSAWSGDVETDYAAFGAFVGTYWLETSFSDLQSERLVRAVHLTGGVPPMAAVTPKGLRWFIDQGIPLPPSYGQVRNAQVATTGEARDPGDYITGWIAKEVAPPSQPDEQPNLIEPTAEEIAARRRSAEEAEEAERAERSVLHFGGVVLGWAKDRRDAGSDDYISLPGRSPGADIDAMVMGTLGALADGRLAEAAALLAALNTQIGVDSAAGLFRRANLPQFQKALMEGRIHQPPVEDDDGAPWEDDPDPSDDATLADAELEHPDSQVAATADGAADIRTPAVPIRKSIHPDYIVCLEDGRKFKSLKRHLRTKYDLSPEEYIARWGLPRDYPMVAPNYAKARADLAARIGLGMTGDAA